MNTLQIGLLISVAVGLVVYFAEQRWMRRQIQRSRAEFEQRHPGKCFVCAFSRFGMQEGVLTEPTPHWCTVQGKWIGDDS